MLAARNSKRNWVSFEKKKAGPKGCAGASPVKRGESEKGVLKTMHGFASRKGEKEGPEDPPGESKNRASEKKN